MATPEMNKAYKAIGEASERLKGKSLSSLADPSLLGEASNRAVHTPVFSSDSSAALDSEFLTMTQSAKNTQMEEFSELAITSNVADYLDGSTREDDDEEDQEEENQGSPEIRDSDSVATHTSSDYIMVDEQKLEDPEFKSKFEFVSGLLQKSIGRDEPGLHQTLLSTLTSNISDNPSKFTKEALVTIKDVANDTYNHCVRASFYELKKSSERMARAMVDVEATLTGVAGLVNDFSNGMHKEISQLHREVTENGRKVDKMTEKKPSLVTKSSPTYRIPTELIADIFINTPLTKDSQKGLVSHAAHGLANSSFIDGAAISTFLNASFSKRQRLVSGWIELLKDAMSAQQV